MDNRWLLSRRALLGGLGAGALLAGLPGRRARAQAIVPKRFVVVHVPEGMWSGAPRPSGGSLGAMFEPLSPFQSKTLVLNGLNMASRDNGPGGDGHHRGVPHMLTGTEMADEGNAGGPSVDQVIAGAIGAGALRSSIQLGVRVVYEDTNSRLIWTGRSRAAGPNEDPYGAYDLIFGGFTPPSSTPTSTPTPTRRPLDLRRSALDHALRETSSLRARLSGGDRDRLDSYQDSLRSIETRLAAMSQDPPPTTGTNQSVRARDSCAVPSLGARISNISDVNRYPDIGRLQMDIMVAALQCDITRVASLQWGNSNDQCTYPWLGVNTLGHDMAHNNDNCDSDGAKKRAVTHWYAEQFAYLLGRFQAIPEGEGTMLDNTVVLWVSEFSDCNGHSADSLLWTLMGNVNGFFRGGQILNMAGRTTNDLHATLCNAFGIGDRTFGNPAYCSGAIDALRA
jgi:Protein of unknown function (DUF1552)